jgi:hypothetical protein
MSFYTSLVENSRSSLVYLVRLKEEPSELDAWYYLQVKSKTLESIFLKKIKTGINLTDYGTILYSGWGDEPPEDIKQKIKEQFG